MIRGAMFWVIWLEMNKLCFTTHSPKNLAMLGMRIISITKYWCTSKGKFDLFNLFLVLPQEIAELFLQVVPVLVEEYLEEEEELVEEASLDNFALVTVESTLVSHVCGQETEYFNDVFTDNT
jgi:hypothetical protein